MFLEFLFGRFKEFNNKEAIIWRNKSYSYNWLLKDVELSKKFILERDIKPGTVVSLSADFSPRAISMIFALIERSCIIVPLNRADKLKNSKHYQIAQVEFSIFIDENDKISTRLISNIPNNLFYNKLKAENRPGLVLFTSGTSGEPKGAVHDFSKLIEKFKENRKSFRTINFLLFDHWGGLNTMFHILSNGGTIIIAEDRSPDSICSLIEKFQVELLPTSPTFLNLLLLSQSYLNYDLSSLKVVTYGTEPMPESTLRRMKAVLPAVKFQQTYGLIEVGVLRSKSKNDDNLWVKVGGEGFHTRIIDGMLQIKAESAMLGYLNAPSPFTKDGYFMTGDVVESDGEYIKILGRKSEIINVGGEKVYPAEVESVIKEMDNINDVTVYGEKNALIGNMVCAKIRLIKKEDPRKVIIDVKKYCREKLSGYKIPAKIIIVDEPLHSYRFKKVRSN